MTDPRLSDPTWLRDMCDCATCRDPHSGQHLLNVDDLGGWAIETAAVVDDQGTVKARLRHAERGDHAVQFTLRQDGLAASSMWGASHVDALRARATMWGDPLDRFVTDLHLNGIALLTGVDVTPGAVLGVAREIGFVRATNYGELFDVQAVAQPSNLAYSPIGLPLHTDNPYRSPRPTVQLLHCLRPAAAGGASQFSDGFRAAEELRVDAPTDFDWLRSTPVEFRYASAEVDLRATRPLIEVGPDAVVRSVAVNHRSMWAASLPAGSERFYTAYRRFVELLAATDAVVALTLDAGELIAFDNRRVLHGRGGFDPTAGRHLQGCYIDIDAIDSAARVVNQQA